MKTCSACRLEKSRTEFAPRPSSLDGLRGQCLDCLRARKNESQRLRRLRYPEKYREAQRRGYHSTPTEKNVIKNRLSKLKSYGLTPESWEALFHLQGERCAICRTDSPGQGWCIDHDHSCCPGRFKSCGVCVRGLLCNRCNVMLAMARDSVGTLEAGTKYLEKSIRRG